MSKNTDDIYEQLGDDMVSHGWLVQCVHQENQSRLEWKSVLAELLARDVEIGDTRQASPEYLEFIAWKGKIEERVARAAERVESLTGPDREFAYWLALRKNVDHFERDEV
ncbi:MAG: hypothetical protein U0796_02930 [Gemmatales bacterium]